MDLFYCTQTNKETPGYFGHIELALPVFHAQYFPGGIENKVIDALPGYY